MNTRVVFFQTVYFLSDNCKTALEAKENNTKCCHTLHGWLWVNHLTSCLMFPVRVPACILPCRDGRRQCLGAGSLRAGGVGEMHRQAALGCRKSGLPFLLQQLLP